MPDPSDHRQHPRYPIVLSIFYKLRSPGPSGGGVGWTRNLSEGGACVEVADRLPPATTLHLSLQTDRGALLVAAEVIWVGGPGPVAGGLPHGVAFAEVTPEQQQALRDLVQRLAVAGHLGVRVPRRLSVLCRRLGEAGSTLQGRTENVSRGGLCLSLPHRLPPETMVEVTLPTPQGPLPVEAAVVWVERTEGQDSGEAIRHGLRFAPLGWTDELTLGLLLAAPE